MAGFRKLDETTIYHGAILHLVRGRFETPDGEVIEREIVRHPGAVAVVPVIDGEAVLVRQYRAAFDREILEIPAGKRDIADEPPEVCAARELEEEVGYTTDDLDLLAHVVPTAGFCDEEMWLYLATDLSPVPLRREGPEEHHMTIERLPLTDVFTMAADGYADAKTTIGLLLARERLGIR